MIANLPTEVVLAISNHLDPSTLFQFAISCRKLYDHVLHLLKAHQGFAQKYSSVDNQHPLSIVTALRRILTDSNAAWHLRDIQVSQRSLGFDQWRQIRLKNLYYVTLTHNIDSSWSPFGFEGAYYSLHCRWKDFTRLCDIKDSIRPESQIQGESTNETISQNVWKPFFSSDELDLLGNLLDCLGCRHHLPGIEKGNEGILLALLICNAPRLRTVSFDEQKLDFQPGGRWYEPLMDIMIEGCASRELLSSQLPAAMTSNFQSLLDRATGFRGLRRLDMGTFSRPRTGFIGWGLGFTMKPQHVVAFSQLPRLESFRFIHYLEYFSYIDYTFEYSLPKPPLSDLNAKVIIEYCHNSNGIFKTAHTIKPITSKVYKPLRNYEWCATTIVNIATLQCGKGSLGLLIIGEEVQKSFRYCPTELARLKSLVIDAEYFNENNARRRRIGPIRLPQSLEYLMIHADGLAWDIRMNRQIDPSNAQGVDFFAAVFISKLTWRLKRKYVPNLKSLCLTKFWDQAPQKSLDKLTAYLAKRRISLHIWSGSLNFESRSCPQLCGIFPRQQESPRWLAQGYPWSDMGPYNWETRQYYGLDSKAYKWEVLKDSWPNDDLPPVFSEDGDPCAELVKDWGSEIFQNKIKELNDSIQAVEDSKYDPNAMQGSKESRVAILRNNFVDELCQLYGVYEDKTRRLEESKKLADEAVKLLGQSSGDVGSKS